MKQLVSLREVNHHLAEYIHSVEMGNEVIITRRGKPIAMIVPLKKVAQLTSQQQKSRKNLLSLMEKGLSLKGETFSRDSLHER
ncbi:MAG: type II toxin-antitoxin system prevent-host-death family antitoxin [Alphaproteobacteria bacterium]|nr:type II toxin-antitoxin system prevent-host-death family antitoxin [Alphaproteobacteria bacterium]